VTICATTEKTDMGMKQQSSQRKLNSSLRRKKHGRADCFLFSLIIEA